MRMREEKSATQEIQFWFPVIPQQAASTQLARSENLSGILKATTHTLLESVSADDSRATAELASCNGHDERNTCFFVDGESLIFGIVIHFHTGSDDWETGVENSVLLGGIFKRFDWSTGPSGL